LLDSPGSYDPLRAPRRAQGANPYDFRQTEKFTADQNRFLNKLSVSFAENVVTQMAPLLQVRFNMELLRFQLRAYSNYLNNLPDPSPMLVFRLDGESQAFLDFDFDLTFAIFEKLMGGRGLPPREEARGYLTDLERAILRRPLSRILAAYGAAWKEFKPVEPQWESLELNPNAVYLYPPGETMVVSAFQVDLGQTKGIVNAVVPFRYLKASIPKSSYDEFVLTKSGTNLGAGGTNPMASVTPIFATKIGGAKVPVSMALGRAELLFRDLLTIEVGDTIRLDTEIREPLRIKVNGRTKFRGFPGVKEGKLAARVSQVLEEGDEEYDE
jgi:flagellar motor switch protein FliM